jgi:ATP-binding cassette, subfamily C, bacterial exporter for protease/lipase
VRLDDATPDQYPDAALARHIGYLPQHLELLAGTIRDNIARFDPAADDAAVIAAAQTAGVHEMVLQLPDGYATQLGYGAPPLSGGQVQRLGLARAIYGLPRYVVLDEPNSNLDAAGDEALARAIMALRANSSSVVVMAHRPSAIAAVNKVLVLHGGRVAEFGPKDEVLKSSARRTSMPAPVSPPVADPA